MLININSIVSYNKLFQLNVCKRYWMFSFHVKYSTHFWAFYDQLNVRRQMYRICKNSALIEIANIATVSLVVIHVIQFDLPCRPRPTRTLDYHCGTVPTVKVNIISFERLIS